MGTPPTSPCLRGRGQRQELAASAAPANATALRSTYRISTTSSALVGWIATVSRRSSRVMPLFSATAKPCRISSDRKSTRLTPVTNAHLVCRLLLEKKKRYRQNKDYYNITSTTKQMNSAISTTKSRTETYNTNKT